MTRREAKLYAYGLASDWIKADIGRCAELTGWSGRDREKIEDALQEISDSLERRACGRSAARPEEGVNA